MVEPPPGSHAVPALVFPRQPPLLAANECWALNWCAISCATTPSKIGPCGPAIGLAPVPNSRPDPALPLLALQTTDNCARPPFHPLWNIIPRSKPPAPRTLTCVL